jgi:hypothetical protein
VRQKSVCGPLRWLGEEVFHDLTKKLKFCFTRTDPPPCPPPLGGLSGIDEKILCKVSQLDGGQRCQRHKRRLERAD